MVSTVNFHLIAAFDYIYNDKKKEEKKEREKNLKIKEIFIVIETLKYSAKSTI